MSEHPTATELEGLVRGDLSREQARVVVRHLLRGCESCIAQIGPYASMMLAGPVAARHAEHDARATPADPAGDAAPASPSASAARSGRRPVAAPAMTAAPAPPPEALAEPDQTLLEHAYDRAIDRAFATVMRHGENAAQSGARAGKALPQLPSQELEGLRELPADLRGFAGYEALLDRSWAMRREDPKQMVKLAELAVEGAAGLGEEGLSAGQVEDVQ